MTLLPHDQLTVYASYHGSSGMPTKVAQKQQGTVSHRMNFWGHPAGPSTVAWDYEGMPWEIVRPDDGLPAARRSVRCRACGKELTFTVYSVTGTGRRQARWRALAWGGLGTACSGSRGLVQRRHCRCGSHACDRGPYPRVGVRDGRLGYVREQHEAARDRFARHVCLASGGTGPK